MDETEMYTIESKVPLTLEQIKNHTKEGYESILGDSQMNFFPTEPEVPMVPSFRYIFRKIQ